MKRILNIALLSFAFGFFIFSPWTIAGTQTVLAAGVILAMVKFVLYPKDKIETMRLIPLISLYYVSYIISNLFSGDFRSAMHSLSYEWLPMTVLFWGSIQMSEKKLQIGLDILIAIASLFSICAIIQHFAGWNFLRNVALEPMMGFYIATGPFGEHLTFGAVYFLIAFFVFGYLLAGGGNTLSRKRLYRIFFGLSTLAVVFSYARSIWLAIIVAALFAAAFTSRKVFAWTLATIAAFWTIVFTVFPSILQRMATIASSSFGSNINRIALWKTAWQMIWHNPIIGLGAGGFTRRFNEFFVGGFCPIRCHPHNDYLQTLVETGLIGLLIYIGIFIMFFNSAIKAIKSDNPFWRSIAMGALVAIVGIMFAGFFECYFVNDEVEEIIFFLLCIGFVAEQRSKKANE